MQYIMRILPSRPFGRRRGAASAIVIATFTAVSAAAQPPRGDSAAVRCATAETGVRARGTPRRTVQESLHELGRCPITGPPAVAAAWRNPRGDTLPLRDLVWASATLVDERTFAAALAAATDRTRPRALRVAGLSVATNHLDPDLLPVFGETYAVGSNLFVSFGGAPPRHVRRVTGSRPIAGDPLARFAAVLDELLDRPGEDEYIQAVARSLAVQQFRTRKIRN